MTAAKSNAAAASPAQEFNYRIPVFSLLLAGPPPTPGGSVLHKAFQGWPSFDFIDMSKDIRGTLQQARSAVEGSVLFFSCANQRQATVLGVVIQACLPLIRSGTMRVIGLVRAANPGEDQAIQKILRVAGLPVFDEVSRITPKAAEFKLRQLAMVARYNAMEGDRRAKSTLDDAVSVPILLRASLPGEVDFWSIIVASGVQRRRGICTWGMIGPPPACGRWVREETPGKPGVQTWNWIPHRVPEWLTNVDADLFHKEKGRWTFRGLCPQYHPTSGSWSFSSMEPLLEFRGEDQSVRVKLQEQNGNLLVAQDGAAMAKFQEAIRQLIMGPMGFDLSTGQSPMPSVPSFKKDAAAEPTLVDFSKVTEAAGPDLYETLFSDVETSIAVVHEGTEVTGKVLDLFEDEITLELRSTRFAKGDRTWIRFHAPGRDGGSPIELLVMAEVLGLVTLDGGTVSTEFRLDGVDLEIMKEFVDIYLERQKAVVDFLHKARGE